jgi:hypothetical protein
VISGAAQCRRNVVGYGAVAAGRGCGRRIPASVVVTATTWQWYFIQQGFVCRMLLFPLAQLLMSLAGPNLVNQIRYAHILWQHIMPVYAKSDRSGAGTRGMSTVMLFAG